MKSKLIQLALCSLVLVCTSQLLSAKPLSFNNITARTTLNTIEVNSPRTPLVPNTLDNEGVFVSDFNRDSWPDLLITGGDSPVLLKNDSGAFEREPSFPDLSVKITYALFLDYNNDDWVDLVLVPQEGRIRLLRNQKGRFELDKIVSEPRLTHAIGATAGDFNGNHCPDLFVIQYNNFNLYTYERLKKVRLGKKTGETSFTTPNGRRNYLLKGNCKDFTPVRSDLFSREHWSLAASAADFNGDGLQDIHVANDLYRDSLYLNQGNGHFKHKYLSRSTNRNGMSSRVLDVNQDGKNDLFVSNIHLREDNPVWKYNLLTSAGFYNPKGHNLLVNRGPAAFDDRAKFLGVKKGGFGWAATYNDFDNDFNFELVQSKQNFLNRSTSLNFLRLEKFEVANFVSDYARESDLPEDVKNENPLFKSFKEWIGYPAYWDRKKESFERLDSLENEFGRINARGVSPIDYDRDGDLDLVFSRFEKHPVLFENRLETDSDWLRISVAKRWIGGELTVVTSDTKRRIPINLKTDFQSQETSFYHLGLGSNTTVKRVEMEWNDGTAVTREEVPKNSLLRLNYRGD